LVVHSLCGFGEHAPRIEARHVAESRIAYSVRVVDVGRQSTKRLHGIGKKERNN
jgi:hypothetical protein